MDKKRTFEELKKEIEMRGGKLMTMADILNLPPVDRELAEANYRAGYRDGFFAGFDIYDDLLYAGASKRGAYSRCWDFWQRKLADWATGDCSKFVLPPGLDIDKK